MHHRSSHSVWNCRYHVVWATKRRRRALRLPEEREYCAKLLRRAATHYDMNIVMLEVDTDHVHLSIEIPPQLSVGDGVRILKSLSARYMLKKFPYLRRNFWTGQMWSPSYFVRSIGEGVTAEMVSRYIADHEAKVQLGPAQAELFSQFPAKGTVRRKK